MQSLNLLVVEDDDIDVLALRRALNSLDFEGDLHVVRSVDEAESHLAETTHPPDLILLDLNLPGRSGHEFLDSLRQKREAKAPIVVLTSSNDELDLQRCFAAAVAGYFVKSLRSEQFEETLSSILDYWSSSQLPKTEVD